MNNLQQTALHAAHVAAGARMVPFAGWDMPVQYGGVIEEVRAVREACGVFDVSHMGQFNCAGNGNTAHLNRIVSTDWSRITIGRVAYGLLLNERGGVIDDIMGYRLGQDEWLIVVNASRAAVDEAHFKSHLPPGTLANRYADQAMLAIQGPRAAMLLAPLVAEADLTTLLKRDCAAVTLAGAPGLLARGGYTGSDGFEFMFKAADAPRVWQALLTACIVPCGLGARDVLRLEAGLPLYGHELREEWTPYESGCGWAVALDKGDFIGRAALTDIQPPRVIKALRMQGRAIPREEYPVEQNGAAIGAITSGTMSPTVGGGIALAMLPRALAVGDAVDVLVRGTPHPAAVVARPFVPHYKG